MSHINRRTMLLGAGAAGAALLGTGALLSFALRPRQKATLDDMLQDADNPVLGNADGDVTIAEFFDYQCPFCKRGHPALMDLVAQDGNIRLVMKDWPIFGAPSIRASQLVLGGVEPGSYETAHAALMATPGQLTEALIGRTLAEAGLDPAALERSYRQGRAKWDALMSRTGAQAAQLGLQGTPAYIIGGRVYSGAMDGEALARAVARARG
ncbi:DsbA family protein [Pontibaca methylaminivorans]|uniref:DsbA family protein n=1 Tax=Pontibaca methylaminivorans TaxID=515897 RepID=UPI002FD8BCDB